MKKNTSSGTWVRLSTWFKVSSVRSTATKYHNDDYDDESHQIHNVDGVESHQIHNEDDDEIHLCVLTLLLTLSGDTAAAANGHRDTLTSGEDNGLEYVAHNGYDFDIDVKYV